MSSLLSSTKETIGTKLIMLVLDRALTGQTYGFIADQIWALDMVRWQISLLAQDADLMLEMLRASFAVTNQTNHSIIFENNNQRSVAYAQRAQVLLISMRSALDQIR